MQTLEAYADACQTSVISEIPQNWESCIVMHEQNSIIYHNNYNNSQNIWD